MTDIDSKQPFMKLFEILEILRVLHTLELKNPEKRKINLRQQRQ